MPCRVQLRNFAVGRAEGVLLTSDRLDGAPLLGRKEDAIMSFPVTQEGSEVTCTLPAHAVVFVTLERLKQPCRREPQMNTDETDLESNSLARPAVLGGLLAVLGSGTAVAKDIYVGGDSPHPTIVSALAEARALPKGEPRRILVHGGAYYNTEVQLTAEDCGLTIQNVPGEVPIFYGGELLTGWEQEGKFQVAQIP